MNRPVQRSDVRERPLGAPNRSRGPPSTKEDRTGRPRRRRDRRGAPRRPAVPPTDVPLVPARPTRGAAAARGRTAMSRAARSMPPMRAATDRVDHLAAPADRCGAGELPSQRPRAPHPPRRSRPRRSSAPPVHRPGRCDGRAGSHPVRAAAAPRRRTTRPRRAADGRAAAGGSPGPRGRRPERTPAATDSTTPASPARSPFRYPGRPAPGEPRYREARPRWRRGGLRAASAGRTASAGPPRSRTARHGRGATPDSPVDR